LSRCGASRALELRDHLRVLALVRADPADLAPLRIPGLRAEGSRFIRPRLELGEQAQPAPIELRAHVRVAAAAPRPDLALVPVIEVRGGPAPFPPPAGPDVRARPQQREGVADEVGEQVLRRPGLARERRFGERPLVPPREYVRQ